MNFPLAGDNTPVGSSIGRDGVVGKSWLNVAIERSGAGLLHGFGAAMVALGWYYLTHKEEGSFGRRGLLALGCIFYAILQHAIWNGSWILTLIPGPIGTFFNSWSWGVSGLTLNSIDLVNAAEVLIILTIFIHALVLMSGRDQCTSCFHKYGLDIWQKTVFIR